MPATTTQPAHVLDPQERRGALVCPRCDARLLHDGANLLCVLCGYEYGLAEFLAHRSGVAHERMTPVLPRVA